MSICKHFGNLFCRAISKYPFSLLWRSIVGFNAHNVSRLGAALAFYSVFALAPTLLVISFIASLFWEDTAVHARMFEEIRGALGEKTALFIQELLTKVAQVDEGTGKFAAFVGLIATYIGVTGTFISVREALDIIWEVDGEGTSRAAIYSWILRRVSALIVLCLAGFILVLSLIANAFLSSLYDFIGAHISIPSFIPIGLHFAVTYFLTAILFAMMFKVLTDAIVLWHTAIVGGLFTAGLFVMGEIALSFYFQNSKALSAYGAAGSFTAILLWIYYSARIFLFGAEFAAAYAAHQPPSVRRARNS